VLQHGEVAVVPDAAADPLFYGGIDEQTGFETRTVLCAPLRTQLGSLGVVEVVNAPPDRMSAEDVEFLRAYSTSRGSDGRIRPAARTWMSIRITPLAACGAKRSAKLHTRRMCSPSAGSDDAIHRSRSAASRSV
jgi:hypothetical protein